MFRRASSKVALVACSSQLYRVQRCNETTIHEHYRPYHEKTKEDIEHENKEIEAAMERNRKAAERVEEELAAKAAGKKVKTDSPFDALPAPVRYALLGALGIETVFELMTVRAYLAQDEDHETPSYLFRAVANVAKLW